MISYQIRGSEVRARALLCLHSAFHRATGFLSRKFVTSGLSRTVQAQPTDTVVSGGGLPPSLPMGTSLHCAFS